MYWVVMYKCTSYKRGVEERKYKATVQQLQNLNERASWCKEVESQETEVTSDKSFYIYVVSTAASHNLFKHFFSSQC